MAGEVTVPVSVPGLVHRELLVMSFLEGLPITRAQVWVCMERGCCLCCLGTLRSASQRRTCTRQLGMSFVEGLASSCQVPCCPEVTDCCGISLPEQLSTCMSAAGRALQDDQHMQLAGADTRRRSASGVWQYHEGLQAQESHTQTCLNTWKSALQRRPVHWS